MRVLPCQVLSVTLSTIKDCEEFKQQYIKFDFLWKQDLHKTLEVRTQPQGSSTHSLCYACICVLLLIVATAFASEASCTRCVWDPNGCVG